MQSPGFLASLAESSGAAESADSARDIQLGSVDFLDGFGTVGVSFSFR